MSLHRSFRRVLRPLASLALAVALAAPLAARTEAHAQFGRQLPSPVSAQQLEQFAKDAGLSTAARDAALRLHEAYFERFRTFEENEVDPALKNAASRDFAMTRSVEDARREADLRRRVLQRAAQIDGQLVDELLGTVGGDDALRLERLRSALARRRAASTLPSIAIGGDELRFDLRTAAVLATVPEATRASLAPGFDSYDGELTRLCERYAEASIARGVKAAQIREEMGLAQAPDAGGEGGEDAMQRWFESMREVQQRASEEVVASSARLRRLHRDTLAQAEPLLSPREAMALRTHLASGVYQGAFAKSAFADLLASLAAKRAAGEFDDSRWAGIEDAVAAHAPTLRSLSDAVMDAEDARAESGEGFQTIVVRVGEDNAGSSDDARRIEARKRLGDADAVAADALRAAAGLPASVDGPQVAGRTVIGGVDLGGGGDIAIGSVAIMVGGDGEAMVLSGDDMDGFGFIGFGGPGTAAPRPMTREELDALATRIALDGAARAAFDGIIEECATARAAAEAEAGQGAQPMEVEAGGAIAIGLSIGPDGGASIAEPDPAKAAALVAAIESAEEKMFDALKAAAPADRATALEEARRMRARVRLATGERGAVTADLVRIVEAAALAEASRAAIAAQLSAWDEASVPALRTMRGEVDAAARERDEVMKRAMNQETVSGTEEGGASVSRSVSFDGEMAAEMQRLDRRIADARGRVESLHESAVAAMADALAADTAAQRAVRRGYLRAANPGIYRRMRDLAPFFERALRAVGDDAGARETVLAIRAELDEAREARCEAFLEEREKAAAAAKSDDEGLAGNLSGMQASMLQTKRLSEDLRQIESSLFRRLVDFVSAAAGAERAKEIGELPSNERRQPSIRFGG